MKRTQVGWLAPCMLLVATDPANAVVTGSFTGAPSTIYVSPGGAYFGPSASPKPTFAFCVDCLSL